MNANLSTDHARGAAAQRDATVQKLEAALLVQHEQARAKLMLALNCGVNDAQYATAFAQAAAASFERVTTLAEARIMALTATVEAPPVVRECPLPPPGHPLSAVQLRRSN